ncbi:MAG: quinone-dependent dihydroorotate dehydrogenase [Anaerolineales bacterium]|jgi:dihydroorotate dehydrogenase|nr:quinone-dependent dihydroorotate dehydrogenase [Anaerolineales bacterium]
MYRLLRPLLFKLDPELAHALTLNLVRLAGRIPLSRGMLASIFMPPEKPVQAFGLTFKNPVGLAAGYDKDCQALAGLSALGFGHLELGTVTPRPQPGNPKPRIFRLIEQEAVINRMGFPGRGMDYAAASLLRSGGQRKETLIGINLGKNKDTALEAAAEDYIGLMRTFAPQADYLAINISSPNTVGLRRLQGREMLEGLLKELSAERSRLPVQPPLLVKIAPDLSDEELDDAVGAILDAGMDGIIATNTTLSREGLAGPLRAETGGLSGRPLTGLSDSVLRKVVARVNGRIPVIGVGGVTSPADAKRKLDLGAALVQVYTGMIYSGPGLVKQIVQQL